MLKQLLTDDFVIIKRLIVPLLLTAICVFLSVSAVVKMMVAGMDISPEFYSSHFENFMLAILIGGVLVGAAVLYLGLLTRWKTKVRIAILSGGLTALTAFLVASNVIFFFASLPPLTDVSLSLALRPWYGVQNWVFSLVPALVTAALFAVAGYMSGDFFENDEFTDQIPSE